MTPYYEHAGITIYHADYRDVLGDRRYNVCAADTMLTDPPFGINKAEWDSEFPHDMWQYIPTSIQSAGFMVGTWNIPLLQQRFNLLSYRWTICAHLVNGMTRGAIGFSNWTPCALYSRDGISLYQEASDIKEFVVNGVKEDHPCPKPLTLTKWFLSRVITPESRTVLDPFCGSGTTLRAAKDTGLQAIGIEIEERYCEIAATRLQQEVLPLEVSA